MRKTMLFQSVMMKITKANIEPEWGLYTLAIGRIIDVVFGVEKIWTKEISLWLLWLISNIEVRFGMTRILHIYKLYQFRDDVNLLIVPKDKFLSNSHGWKLPEEKEWVRLKNSLNGSGKLNWIMSERTTEVVFLDLQITINKNGYIEMTMYQKPMNLHLYIPGLSAYPEGCLNGTILGSAIIYLHQNIHINDFMKLMAEFAKHLKSRGHEMREIETMKLEAAKRIDSGGKSNSKNRNNYKTKATQKHCTHTGNITLLASLRTPSGRHTIRLSWASIVLIRWKYASGDHKTYRTY
jgi:hypothetical protein